MARRAAGPFAQSLPLIAAGGGVAVPTPSHTAGHVSVVVLDDARQLVLAGDAACTARLPA